MSSVYTYGFPINNSVYGFCDVSCGVWGCEGVKVWGCWGVVCVEVWYVWDVVCVEV